MKLIMIRLAAVPLLASVVLTSGCGDSGSSPTSQELAAALIADTGDRVATFCGCLWQSSGYESEDDCLDAQSITQLQSTCAVGHVAAFIASSEAPAETERVIHDSFSCRLTAGEEVTTCFRESDCLLSNFLACDDEYLRVVLETCPTMPLLHANVEDACFEGEAAPFGPWTE